MGLVDYSDSESDSESPAPNSQPAKQPSSSSKPFQKLVSRSNPGKIVISLPTASGGADGPDQKPSDGPPPAKRARTGAGGGGRFSNFGSFLPAPKTTTATTTAGKTASSSSSSSSPQATAGVGGGGNAAPRPGIHLKTGAEPAFDREQPVGSGSGLNLPPPKQSKGPSIHPDQKPEEEVKLVGKPLMFKPLSVARNPAKKKNQGGGSGSGLNGAGVAVGKSPAAAAEETKAVQEEPARKKKISLFSIPDGGGPAEDPLPAPPGNGAYEPLFLTPTAEDGAAAAAYGEAGDSSYPSHAQQAPAAPAPHHRPDTLSSIADDMNLSAAARRELFGRGGPSESLSSAGVIRFDMEREYAHNETVRAAGDTAVHNPVRAIAPGKHSLRQLVNSVQSNRTALEDSFMAAKSGKKDAAGRYGW
ncbi:mitotic checkpoint regulator, MAD2B-interacting-domain-containing protein [Phialemonium atrogriseum]|uniref:Mitotic checkpoint regulator, MAD2B-interacting-domain-containing protein n=1 Tax=Phialemonium atrogriseum TaxID=1093897 RepID=A0AAJ0BWK7_9PEZI|nr:mitotic checkpoint regulator, MAD2B-interacting-domain-containing protein [Phialemonium atrogriseum]KAK1765804.1 mitotic checkpoint regulator, MAD2B-interacting-domain-containing protein [Phialemonium atrogriseum]